MPIFEVSTPDGIKVKLEQGNADQGWAHILSRHLKDFQVKSKEIKTDQDLQDLLKTTLLKEEPVLKIGTERHYQMGSWALLIVVGSQSQIVTAMPLTDPSQLRQGDVSNESRLQVLSASIGASSDGLFASDELSPQERIERALKQHYALDLMKVKK